MAKNNKFAGFCRTLMLAASVIAITATAAYPQDLGDLNDQILANPQDSSLSLRYAQAAEEMGQLRLALAGYERVMINEPDNIEARRGYERVRRMLEPPFTTFRLEVGARWDSNVLNSGIADEEAYSIFSEATLIDERPFGGARRWRSIVNFEGEVTPEFDQLNYAFLGAQTGPLFYVAPHVAAIPSIGVGVATLDGSHYFNDINASLTIEGKQSGVSYWSRLRGGWRDYSDESTADNGVYAEAMGGVSVPRILSESDTLTVVPWVRWSDIEGSTFNFLTGEVTPGEFFEYGVDAAYHYQANDHIRLSGGAVAREREYSQTMVGPSERRDTYVAPEVAMTVGNIMPCECAVRMSYQYRFNDSNDPAADFDAQRVSLSLIARF